MRRTSRPRTYDYESGPPVTGARKQRDTTPTVCFNRNAFAGASQSLVDAVHYHDSDEARRAGWQTTLGYGGAFTTRTVAHLAAASMSGWGDLTTFATSALKNAQKKIDKVLDIADEEGEPVASSSEEPASLLSAPAVAKLQDDFFNAFGLQGAGRASATVSPQASPKPKESANLVAPPPLDLEKPAGVDASSSPSGLNIGQWLLGGSTVDAGSEGELPLSPRAADDVPKERRQRKAARSLGARKSVDSAAAEKRPKADVAAAVAAAAPASAQLQESCEAELLLLEAEAGAALDTELLVDTSEEERVEESFETELATPVAESGGWDDEDWSKSAVLKYEAESDKEEDAFTLLPQISPEPMDTEDQPLDSSEMGTSLGSSESQSTTIVADDTKTSPTMLSLSTADVPLSVSVEEEERRKSESSSSPGDGRTATGSSEEEVGDSSLSSSFVRLTTSAAGSPPLSTQKSETSSVRKGSAYASPTETAASSDIEIIDGAPNDNGSEKSWASSAAGFLNLAPVPANSPSAAKAPKLSSSGFDRKRGGSDVVQKLMESLELREKQNLDQSSKLMSLVEENEELRAQVAQLSSVEDLGPALANLRDKFSAAAEERDALRARLEAVASVEARLVQMERQLKEKDEQVSDLIREGEALSQKELKQGNVIKKLREKEKASEKATEALKTRLLEMDNLKAQLKEKKEQEIKYDEAVHSLKSQLEKTERRVRTAELESTEAREKAAAGQAALEAAYAQIAQLSLSTADRDKLIQKLNDDAEASQEQQLRDRLQDVESRRQAEVEELGRRSSELAASLERSEAEAERREAALKADVAALQRRLADSESRNEELAADVAKATAPLLRQMDSLGASHAAQASQWERLEADLYARLKRTEQRGLDAEAKEAEAQAALLDLRGSLGATKAETDAARRALDDARADVAKERKERRRTEEAADRAQRELASQRQVAAQQLEELKEEKEMIASEFLREKKELRSQMDGRISDLLRQIDDKESAIGRLRSELLETSRGSLSTLGPAVAKPPSPASSVVSFSVDEGWGSERGGTGGVVETLRQRLQARDGELGVLREELRLAHASRDAAAAQVAAMANTQGALTEKAEALEPLRAKYKGVEEQQTALLAMYGEKVEENEELRLDLEDMKAMYRQQIEELLNR